MKRTGERAMELLLLEQKEKDLWETLARPGKKAKPGTRLVFGDGLLTAQVVVTTSMLFCLSMLLWIFALKQLGLI